MKLYFKYFSIHLKSVMQYKTSFLLTALGQMLVTLSTFFGIHFMFQRFHSVEGFTYSEVLICFTVVLLSFSLAECFFRGFDAFSSMISNGEFDRVLVRPRNEIFQVLGSKIEFTRVGRVLIALALLIWALSGARIDWCFTRAVTLVLMILGGAVIFSGLFMLYAGFCFFTIEGLEFMNIFTDGMREHGSYPLAIYGKRVMQFCTYIIPYTLVQYYPLMYLIGKTDDARMMLLPLLACLFIIPCWLFWRCGVHRYKSTGS